jgi:hypothetical protein
METQAPSPARRSGLLNPPRWDQALGQSVCRPILAAKSLRLPSEGGRVGGVTFASPASMLQ